MRKLLFAITSLWAATAAQAQTQMGAPNLIVCNKTATFTGTAANAVLVAAAANKITNICGWHVTTSSATAVTFTLSYGTQTTNPCDTGNTALTSSINITSAAPSNDHLQEAFTNTGVNTQLCVNAPVTVFGQVYYTQIDAPH